MKRPGNGSTPTARIRAGISDSDSMRYEDEGNTQGDFGFESRSQIEADENSDVTTLSKMVEFAPGSVSVSIEAAIQLALTHVIACGEFSVQSVEKFTQVWTLFGNFMVKVGGYTYPHEIRLSLVHKFISARGNRGWPSTATMHARRAAVRLLFRLWRELHIVSGDPTLDILLDSRGNDRSRPLTDDEMGECEVVSVATLDATRQPSVLGLAQITAVSSEIAQVTIGDIDLDAGTVYLKGCRSASKRTGQLTQWGIKELARRIKTLDDDKNTLIAYEGSAPCTSAKAQSSVGMALVGILGRAGLFGDPQVSVQSVRGWAGRKEHERTGRIEDAARKLGCKSLDNTALVTGWNWKCEAEQR
ncbi:MAG TPA: hypothetical protein VMU77_01685 [Acidimicrobiales bacterium]|nr:hypothetical protein [Acidimicrobiales bacterium]